jgi:hypothetical protein
VDSSQQLQLHRLRQFRLTEACDVAWRTDRQVLNGVTNTYRERGRLTGTITATSPRASRISIRKYTQIRGCVNFCPRRLIGTIQVRFLELPNQTTQGFPRKQIWRDCPCMRCTILVQEPDRNVPIKKSGEVNCMVISLRNARSSTKRPNTNQFPHVNSRRTPVQISVRENIIPNNQSFD